MLNLPGVALVKVFKLSTTAEIVTFLNSSESSRRKFAENTQGLHVSFLWKIERDRVFMKINATFTLKGQDDPTSEEEDWTGKDGSLVFIFSPIIFEKISAVAEERGIDLQRVDHLLNPTNDGVYWREKNRVVANNLEWSEIAQTANYYMSILDVNKHEVTMRINAVHQFAEIFSDPELGSDRFCKTLELDFPSLTGDELDLILSKFTDVHLLILGKRKVPLTHNNVINYKNCLIHSSPTISLNDLLLIHCDTIEIADPKFTHEYLNSFILAWFWNTTTEFSKLRLDYAENPMQINIRHIQERFYTAPYCQIRRSHLRKLLDDKSFAQHSHLFHVPSGFDIMRPDGLVGTLMSHKNSIFFVAWHRKPIDQKLEEAQYCVMHYAAATPPNF